MTNLKTTADIPWWDDETAPTPALGEFLAQYEGDSNLWWRLGCGHHQNLFEAAVDDAVAARARAATAELVIGRVVALVRNMGDAARPLDTLIHVRQLQHALTGTYPGS